MAATRFGSVPAGRSGFGALAAFFAGFPFTRGRLLLADFFCLDFVASGAKTRAGRKVRQTTCERPFRGGYGGFSLRPIVPRRFSWGAGSKTPDRIQTRPRPASPAESRHPRGP